MGFLKQGFSGALAAVMVLTSGGLCVGQSVTIHAETKAKTYEDYKKVLNYTFFSDVFQTSLYRDHE